MAFTKDLFEAIISKLRILEDRIVSIEQKETSGAPRGTAGYIPKYKVGGIGLEESKLNESGASVFIENDSSIGFRGTDGGGGQGITYEDSGAVQRFGILFPGSDTVVIANRASNGKVNIRANNSTAGTGGEKTIETFYAGGNDDVSGSNKFGRKTQTPLSTISGGNCGVITQQFMKQMAGDNTITAVFRVVTNDATDDAGHYLCVANVLAMNNSGGTFPSGTSGETATAHEKFGWVRAMENGGTGVNSALYTEHGALVSAATAPATRDIVSISGSLSETSEFEVRFRVQIDGGGTSPTPLYAMIHVELMWAGFDVEPQILSI